MMGGYGVDKIFYGVFLVVSAAIAGICAFGIYLNVVLWHNDPKRHMSRLLIKIGYVITAGVLLTALISQGSTPATWRAWLYLLGLSISGLGLGQLTLFDVEEKVITDVPRTEAPTVIRLDVLEKLAAAQGLRITLEEERNTAAEEAAAKHEQSPLHAKPQDE